MKIIFFFFHLIIDIFKYCICLNSISIIKYVVLIVFAFLLYMRPKRMEFAQVCASGTLTNCWVQIINLTCDRFYNRQFFQTTKMFLMFRSWFRFLQKILLVIPSRQNQSFRYGFLLLSIDIYIFWGLSIFCYWINLGLSRYFKVFWIIR